MTAYEYDGGRLVRAVTVSEPEWLPIDRAEIVALAEFRASLCPAGCGQPLDESTAHYTSGPEYDTGSTACRACAALAEHQRADADKATKDTPSRLYHVIRLPRG